MAHGSQFNMLIDVYFGAACSFDEIDVRSES